MLNYPWGLTPSNITASKTATQEWVADNIITKRALSDFNVYVDPMADITTTKFTVVVSYAGDPSTPLFTAELTHSGGEDTRWSWSPFGSTQSISIDYYSNSGSYHLFYNNLQDGGGNEHDG